MRKNFVVVILVAGIAIVAGLATMVCFGQLTRGEALSIFVLAILVIITTWYARVTARIATATSHQAETQRQTVKEMKRQVDVQSLTLKELQDSLKMQAYQGIYGKMINIDQFFMDHSNLKLYIYDGKDIADISPDETEKVLSACEMLLDLFEESVGYRQFVTKEKWGGWEKYMQSIYEKSKAIKYFLNKNKGWYTEELINVLKKEEKG